MARSPRSRRSTGSKRAGRRCGRRHGTYRFDRTHDRARDLLDRHAAADGERLAAHGFGLRLRADRLPSRATSACAAAHVFYPMGWDDNGLPTERRVQNYFGVRCEPHLPYDPAFVPPDKPGKDVVPISRPNFLELCEQLVARGRSSVRGAVAPARAVGRLEPDLHDDRARARGAPVSARSCATSHAARRTRPTRRRCGTSTSAPRSRRPSSRTARCRARTTRCASTRPTARATCSSTRPGPSCSPRASPSSRTPTTRATSRCSAPRSSPRCTASRVPIVAHHLADPEKGTGIAMICTFGDTTDVVWWRELQLPTARDPRHRRPVQAGSARVASRPTARAAYAQIAGRNVKQAQKIVVEQLQASGELDGEPRPDHAPGEVLREGRTPARDRHLAPVVPAQRRPRPRPARRAARARSASCAGTRRTCASATTRGSTG